MSKNNIQGNVFTVDIVVDPAGASIFGAQCRPDFNEKILKATSQKKGTFLNHDGTNTIDVTDNINNTIGIIGYGETRIGNPEVIGDISEKGVLASITFEVISAGTSELVIDAKISDSKTRPMKVAVDVG